MSFNNFEIKKDDNILNQTNDLVSYLDKKTEEKNYLSFAKKFSKFTEIPVNVINYEFKKSLTSFHNFQSGKFKKILGLKNIFFSGIYYFLLIIYIFIFSKKNNHDAEKIDIIFDEVLAIEEEMRIENIKKNFKNFKIVSNKKYFNHDNYIIINKHKGYLKSYINRKLTKYLFNNFFAILNFSIKDKTNYFPVISKILIKVIRYESIFQKYQPKFIFQERHYTTSAIKNFIFKKFGGAASSCGQRIIIHLGETCYYVNTDIFFSLGNKTAEVLQLCGSKIKEIKPIGSLSFNMVWINAKKIETPKIDIIYIAGNNLESFGVDKNYINNYYTQLNWLKKLSYDFPDLKIVIKHHVNNKHVDKRELKIIENTKIERLVSTEADGTNYSYGYAINSKIRLTWCSTMAYELLGHNIPCYFLDPNLENKAFLHDYDYNKFWRIDTYSKLKKKIKDIVEKKINDKVAENENFCIKSENVSKEIANCLKRYN